MSTRPTEAEAELEALVRAKLAKPRELGIGDAIGLLPSWIWALAEIDRLRERVAELEATHGNETD